ncbi:MAG: Hsp20/alpha crystallin family protein [Candidatus Omnitrophica bacterium]|nr:Hsp20/alpha crystallin family protein [Candidatus Omnitrophota bacterium]
MNLIPRRRNTGGFWVDPFKELDRIHQDMNSLLNWSITDGREGNKEGQVVYAASPSIDYEEDENNVLIKADLPGIDKKNLDIRVQDGTLTIKGERSEEQKSKNNGARVTERYYGSFFRQITLPVAVDESKIAAEYKDGVLSLTLPKKEEAKPKQIKVEVK